MKNRKIITLFFLIFVTIMALYVIQIKKRKFIEQKHIIANYFCEILNNGFCKVVLFVSPMDCYSCSEYVLSEQFYSDLIDLGNENGIKPSLYYVVGGGFSEETKRKYMSKSSKNAAIIFKQNNNVEFMLRKLLKTDKTPLMIVLDHENRMIYWQGFIPDEVTVFRQLRIDLLNKLGEVL